MTDTSQILVGCNEKIVCIRVRGRGSFQNSAGIKQFAKEMIQRGHREFVVDLADCPAMDSTFMGTLTGVALQLQSLGHGNLHVIRCNERNTDLLQNLGLDQILDLADAESPAAGEWETPSGMNGHTVAAGEGTGPDAESPIEAAGAVEDHELECPGVDRQGTTEVMLAAHQALVDADPQNFSKFKDVLDYLKQDLQRGAPAD